MFYTSLTSVIHAASEHCTRVQELKHDNTHTLILQYQASVLPRGRHVSLKFICFIYLRMSKILRCFSSLYVIAKLHFRHCLETNTREFNLQSSLNSSKFAIFVLDTTPRHGKCHKTTDIIFKVTRSNREQDTLTHSEDNYSRKVCVKFACVTG